MRILVCCDHGNVRSACLARLLKKQRHEAVATGLKVLSPSSLRVFITWADLVVDVSTSSQTEAAGICAVYKTPYLRKFIGEDVWRNPDDPDLVEKCQKIEADLLILIREMEAN